MLSHVKLSRSAAARLEQLRPSNAITSLLDGLEASIAETAAEQQRSVDFLKHYVSPATPGHVIP
jgi:hypothetical protein